MPTASPTHTTPRRDGSPARAAWAWSIRSALMWLVVATMAPVIALIAYTGYRDHQHAQTLASQTALGLARVTADNVATFVSDTRLMMSKLAQRTDIRGMAARPCGSIFREFRDLYPQFANFSQASLDGELICSTTPQPDGRRTVIRDAVWFQRVIKVQDFVVAPPYTGPVSGRRVAVLAHPVRDDAGRMIGSIQLPVDLVNFKPVMGGNNLPWTTVITLLDPAGTIVARSQSPERFVGTRPAWPIVAQVLDQRTGTARALSADGIDRVYGFVPVAGTDWTAVAGLDADVVFADAEASSLRNTALGLLIVAFAAGLALTLRRRIAAPIEALRNTAECVAGGALDARAPVGGPVEIAQVATQFNAMLDARAAQVRTLADNESDLRLLFESSLEGILRTRPDGTILRANPAACELLGRSEQALQRLGRASISDDPRLASLIEERERTGRARGEASLIRGDGTRFECAVSTSLYTATDGTPRGNIFLRDLTDRLQKEELRSGKEAAELASREKSAFLARMSHELRTPLNAILGFAQLLQFDPSIRASAKASAMIEHVRSAGLHLLSLIDEVLDLSRIEAGALALNPENMDLQRLVTECVALTAPVAEGRQVTVHIEPAGTDPWIVADRTRVRQVLVNVLANAIKYNREGGSVWIRLSGSATQLEVAIEDTGVGLSPEQIAHLFQPFNRLGAEASGVEGTGLGLVIVKQLLEAMQASVHVDSAPGVGSTFTLRFPRNFSAAAPASDSPTTAM